MEQRPYESSCRCKDWHFGRWQYHIPICPRHTLQLGVYRKLFPICHHRWWQTIAHLERYVATLSILQPITTHSIDLHTIRWSVGCEITHYTRTDCYPIWRIWSSKWSTIPTNRCVVTSHWMGSFRCQLHKGRIRHQRQYYTIRNNYSRCSLPPMERPEPTIHNIQPSSLGGQYRYHRTSATATWHQTRLQYATRTRLWLVWQVGRYS